jgi:radical SAM superfamily enzyme YgiQ (UPF0313 family)
LKAIFYYPRLTPHTKFPTCEPLQLIFLSRALRENNIDVDIIDGRLFNEDELLEHIKQKMAGDTACFGITSLTCYQLIDALNVSQFVKEHYPEIPVIIGGWHATIFPEETLRENAIDIVIRGQGEITLLEVLKRTTKSKDLTGVKGVSWKKDNTIIKEEDRPVVSPDVLPEILPSDFEKLDLKYYQLNSVLFYMSSIGCPYSCSYCCVNSACKRKWLPLSAEKIMYEIKGLHNRFGFKEVIFWDNVFFSSQKRVSELCEHIINKRLNISWSAHARINEIKTWDDGFVRLLKEGGCKSVFIGIESGSQKILDRINKGIKANDIIPALRKLKSHDIDVATNWMVGLPEEKYDDVLRTIECINEGLKIYNYDIMKFKSHIYRFAPFPGTPIYDSLPREEVLKLPGNAKEWGTYIYEKLKDGIEPWKEKNGPSMFASTTFYLWMAYLNQKEPETFLEKTMRKISKFRVNNRFLRFPLEWWLWKKMQKTH